MEGVMLARETGSPLLLGFCLSFHGRAALDRGALTDARAQLEEALALPRSTANASNTAIALVALAEVFLALDDAGGAEPLLGEAVALARQSGNRLVIAGSLLASARFARSHRTLSEADALANSAIESSSELGNPSVLAAALDGVAGIAVAEGRFVDAARLFGAAKAVRDGAGATCPPAEQLARNADLAILTKALPALDLGAAVRQGAGLSPEEASAYARRGRGPRRRPSTGWSSLTPAERQVARLVAQGLTNPEIGARLLISRRTVQTHVSHVFVKVGVRSRRELGRLAPHDLAM